MATNNATNFAKPIGVVNGGTGVATFTTYAPLCGGTTSTGALQQATTGFSSSGNILVSQGASALPQWSSPGAGSSFVFIRTESFSGTQDIVFNSTYITSTYTTYLVVFKDLTTDSGTNSSIRMTLSTDNGSNYLATNYQAGLLQNNYNAGGAFTSVNSTTNAPMGNTVNSSNKFSGFIYLTLPSSDVPSWVGKGFMQRSGSTSLAFTSVFGNNSGTTTINNIKFSVISTGNFSGGAISLYGITQ